MGDTGLFVPVIHEYKHDPGIFMRSNIDGQFITFQVYPSAARFLDKMGYSDGDTVRWGVIKPLWERGYIHTGKSGTTEQVDTHLKQNRVDDLDGHEEEELNDFFEQQDRQSISVPDDIYETLSEWHDGKYSRERARDLLYNAKNRERCLDSLREFSYSRIRVTGIDTSKGDFAYDVVSKDREIRCIDIRHEKDEPDFIITFRGPSDNAQALIVDDGDLRRWKIYAPRDSLEGRYQRDLLEYFPAIVDLLTDIPSYDLRLDTWDFGAATNVELPPDVYECLQLDWEWCTYSIGRADGRSSRLDGEIELQSSIGYGIVSTTEIDEDLVFESSDTPTEIGQKVSFSILRAEGVTRAVDVCDAEQSSVRSATDGETKYGNLISQSPFDRQPHRDAGSWSEGTIHSLVRKEGFGYVRTDTGDTLYFALNELSDLGLTPSTPVRFRVSADGTRALKIEPKTPESDGPDTPDEQPPTDGTLEVGQSRVGRIRYLNHRYGSLAVDGTSETILFRAAELPVSSEKATSGMAFSFQVSERDGGLLRATKLQRLTERDRVDAETKTAREDDEFEIAGEPPVSEAITRWIVRQALDPISVFSAIESAVDLGIEPTSFESSVEAFGSVPDVEVSEFRISDAGNPLYRFPLDEGGHWTVEHEISATETTVDVLVHPEDAPNHRARAIDGKFVYWRPEAALEELSAIERHEFIVAQGTYVSMVHERL